MEKKLCPNCGMPKRMSYCMHCGYMDNGNMISKKPIITPDLEHYLGKDYDAVIRNKKFIIPGLLGPVYIFSHGFYLEGFFLILFDSFLSLFVEVLNHAFLFSLVILLFNFVYILINRIIWSSIGNVFYLKLLSKRIDEIKRKNPDMNLIDLEKYYIKDKRWIVLKYIFFGLLFLILFLLLRGKIYQWLQLL